MVVIIMSLHLPRFLVAPKSLRRQPCRSPLPLLTVQPTVASYVHSRQSLTRTRATLYHEDHPDACDQVQSDNDFIFALVCVLSVIFSSKPTLCLAPAFHDDGDYCDLQVNIISLPTTEDLSL
jgi:hypothetical protein